MSNECKLEFEDFDDFDELDELDGIDWNNSELQIIEQKSSNLNYNTTTDNHPTNSYTPDKQHIIGFDEECGKTWHYPIDFPLRDYQFSIVRKCLFNNTLVCLPTGLGKTFIAAVVMLNFYRWYPQGKIVFLAPTKPLVNQQINACCKITALPRYEVVELTGATSSLKRVNLWRDNRVFFLTPQVMQNDLSSGICPAKDIVCCVLDEAHKALGNYAYTQVVKELLVNSVKFRVLALSATPGDDLSAIQEVINNLLINCIELRTEESIDVIPYTHHKKVEKYVVKIEGTLGEIHSKFLNVLSGIVKKLHSQKAVYTEDPKRLCRYQLIKARENFRSSVSGAFIGPVEGEFAVGISLYHSYEQLYSSGIRACYQSIKRLLSDGKSSARLRSEVIRNVELNQVMSKMEKLVDSMHKFFIRTNSMDPNLSIVSFGDASFDLTSTLASDDFFYSHPKLLKLEEIVVSHFRKATTDNTTNTRVMIFSSFRDSVEEISVMLHRHAPLVRVMCFYGHGNKPTGTKGQKGFTQKEQLKVMERFREGGYNVLVSTCVGEEGLDIGDVDLIVCFDSPKAPTRYVQRMGRTGRKREGRIVMLLSEGKEEQAYQKCQTSKKHIYKIVTEGHKHLNFHRDSPKMVPKHISPQPSKLYLQQQQQEEEEKIPPAIFSRGLRNNKKGKKILENYPGFSSAASEFNKNRDQFSLSKEDLNRWTVKYCLSQNDTLRIQQRLSAYTGHRPMLFLMDEQQRREISSIPVPDNTEPVDCSKWLDWQSSIQTGTISHSTASKSLIDCIKTIDNLKNSDTAADEHRAALQIDRTDSHEDQSIHTGLTQLTLRTNINKIPSKSHLPRNKKKHTKIDNSNSDSDIEHSITPTGTDNIIKFPDKPDNIDMNHPFASATVRQKIFALESSSDEINSDDSQAHKSRNFPSPPPAQCEDSVNSIEDLLNTPRYTRNKPVLPLSLEESTDQSIHSSPNKINIMDEESVELVFVDGNTSNNNTPIQTSFDIHVAPKHTLASPLQYDSSINGPGISMLSKTSTPNKSSNFIDPDVICIVRSNENPKNCTTISPMLNPITSSSFLEDIPGPANGNTNRVRRKAKTPNFESSDSENEALKSLCRKRKFQFKRQIISSQFSPVATVVNNPKKKRKLNYFIDHEAIESDGEYSQDSFQSLPTTSTSNADTNTEEISVISRLIADTSGSATGINESSMYARYVHDLISPPINQACKLVIDPKRHRTLATAGKNILK
ncbi:hypothetical protein LOD99_10224 [Oopsacas minuta]|uniref:Fanconi anemia group M protein n=1 Tax=Oopsacas minuta TaxID=111878 RepID=A0AAV7KLT4_9METZ|nr:hypothetical protein LOD99_10224 [Oopsacas minuta]